MHWSVCMLFAGDIPLANSGVCPHCPLTLSAVMSHSLPLASPIAARRSFVGRAADRSRTNLFLLYLRQGFHALLVDLQYNARVSVSDFAYPIFGSGTEQFGSFRGRQLVVFSNPPRHVCGSTLKSIIQRSSQSHSHDMGIGFHPRPGRPSSRNNIDAELNF